MEVFIARQPIFSLNGEVFGYEILYRDSETNEFSESDADFASGNALTRCFIDFGIADLTNGKKAFVNFTAEFLRSDIATIFPKDFLVVEILETVTVDADIKEKLKVLKSKGYLLALDDFTGQPGFDEIMDLLDIIKVDFRLTTEEDREQILKRYHRKGLRFLAEKIETPEEYHSAVRMGFTYFQGYFLARPEIGRKKKFIPFKKNRLELIRMLNSENPEFDDVATLIESDLAFSYEILRLVNSAYYGQINQVKSIRFALLLLGFNEIRKWLYLAFISDLQQDAPDEIISVSMLRGKFMENLADRALRPEYKSELLTIGMFSTIDLMLDKPMDEVLTEMHFSDSIRRVLSGEDTIGFTAQCYRTVLSYEQGKWDEAQSAAARIGVSPSALNMAYLDALKWMSTIRH